jgi:hypothetical protein
MLVQVPVNVADSFVCASFHKSFPLPAEGTLIEEQAK